MPVTVDHIRPLEQLLAVRDIVESDRFAFACNATFLVREYEDEFYYSPFTFVYYDVEGRIHVDEISVLGDLVHAYAGVVDNGLFQVTDEEE